MSDLPATGTGAVRLAAAVAVALLVAVRSGAAAERGASDVGAHRRAATSEAAVGGSVSVRFRTAPGLDAIGWAMLTADGDRSIVAVTFEGGEGGLPASIRVGRCEAPEPEVHFPLTDVYPGRTTTTTVQMPLADLVSGDYAIDIHRRSPSLAALEDASGVIACGDIGRGGGARSAGGMVAALPATGSGSTASSDAGQPWVVVGLGTLGLAFGRIGLEWRRRSDSPASVSRWRGWPARARDERR